MCKDITFLCITFKPTNFPGVFPAEWWRADLEFGFKTQICNAGQLMEAANEMRSEAASTVRWLPVRGSIGAYTKAGAITGLWGSDDKALLVSRAEDSAGIIALHLGESD
jgi:hypothetical protein